MLAAITSASLLGVTGHRVIVEVHVGNGLPGFQVVGLPDEVCRESRDRARAAVLSSKLDWPSTKRITVNLAPSGLRKGGSGLDLAIAVGVLVASEVLPPAAVEGLAFLAELGLDGSLRPVPGVAPMVAGLGGGSVVVAPASRREAIAAGGDALVALRLEELVAALRDGVWPDVPVDDGVVDEVVVPDLAEVRGQANGRLGLEIAAAGGHHVMLVGPPGAGKTMLAKRIVGLLPELDHTTALEATMVHSAAGVRLPANGMVTVPPFRAPHHSASMVALVGGGSHHLRPGEVSLAHGGALFLDELGEFPASVLDALRQPLEEGVIRVARANCSATLPARVLLIGATNPCPCGGGPPGACVCDEGARQRYLKRLSGPLLDRFDLRVAVARTGVDELLGDQRGEPTAVVRERVADARDRALLRQGFLNAAIPGDRLDELAPLATGALRMLRDELEHERLTGRGYHRVRRVARTLADLRGADVVEEGDVVTALALRVQLRGLARSTAA